VKISREGQYPNRSTSFYPETAARIGTALSHAVVAALENLKTVIDFDSLSPERQVEVGSWVVNRITAEGNSWIEKQLKTFPVDKNNRI